MKITEEQIKKAYQDKEYLKELFPSVFEENLEVGKWYKYERFLILVLDEIHWCGFGYSGSWEEKNLYDNLLNDKDFVPATKEEVETALIAEAKKRGFKEDVSWKFNDSIIEYRAFDDNFFFHYGYNILYIGSYAVFNNGIWAKIIEEPLELTLEQIAEKFNVDNVKIIKS